MTDLIKKQLETMDDLLTIGQVSDLFKIHPDTLRNWEKSGELVPLRVGPRKDRKYRKQDIETIVAKMGSKLTLQQLEQFLWKSADILRGKIDSSDYKKYIFGLLFYKRISDVWDEEYKKVLEEFKDKSLAEADYNHRFQVPKDCNWQVIAETSENIGQKLNEIFDKITNVNSPKLDKIFDDLDFANKDRFPNETLQKLINHFSQYNFSSNYISSDLLGDAYEYLIKEFAADAGKKGGEFYTPREVERVIIGIVKPHQKDHIYDPTVGSGGFLLEAFNYLKDKAGDQVARSLYLYGQEVNISTFAIARINCFLHGLDSADIRRGDTLANPQFINNMGGLQTFDIVVANPPYSIKDWEFETFRNDKYGRIDGYELPPQKNADFAFLLHIVKSLNSNGRAGIILPRGVLSRVGVEGRIREKLIKNDLIDAIISLPIKLFYGTGISASIWILNKNKSEERKNKILIIDASKEYSEGKNQNNLRKQDIEKIIKTYDQYQDTEKYARIVDLNEVKQNDFNLDCTAYVDSSETVLKININEIKKEISQLETDIKNTETELNNLLIKVDVSKKIRYLALEDLAYDKPSAIADGPFGSNLKISDYVSNGIPVLQGNNITGNKFKFTDIRFITSKKAEELKRSKVVEGDLLIVKIGSVGYSAIIDSLHGHEYAIIPANLMKVSVDPSKINPKYLYYFLTSDIGVKQLRRLSSSTAQPAISLSKVRKLKIPVLDKDNERKITDLFIKLDQSIENINQKTGLLLLLKKGLMQEVFSQKVEVN